MGKLHPGAKPPADSLRVLVVDDNPADAELCLYELRKGGVVFSADIAETREEFMDFVHSNDYDIVLSDYNLRSWNALDAIQIIREEGKDIPFLLVTGSLGDEDAVLCVKKGVSDYVLKDRMARLPVSIERALQEKTERVQRSRLEEQLQQAQKMEAIGRMAGGIAHDFNNLLTVITGYSQLGLERLSADHPIRGYLDQIKAAGDRAASLTRQLLAFSRKQVLEPQVLDLNEVIDGIDKMVQRLIGEDIEVVTLGSPDLAKVKADPGQIEQVIMNLVVNARDAMPQGGRLTFETANVDVESDRHDQHRLMPPGQYVMLAVSDTGVGMSPEVQSRIFEPFFTTKEHGKGTGLGLSTVYGIIKQSGGFIWVYSEPGMGTAFKIYLPSTDIPGKEARNANEVSHAAKGTETILVVEDNESVRRFVHGVLESKGYTLLQASGSVEAAKLIEGYSGRIHLMLTDVVMPRMSGTELAARLAQHFPEAKVLYMSGYTDNAIVQCGALEAGTHFLQKPFTPEALARKIRKVLDA